MKKKILVNSSLLILAVLMSVVSIQAQTIGAYEAQIPFDFSVGETSYNAGEYVVRLQDMHNNYMTAILSLKNAEGEVLKATAVTENGNKSKKDKTTLVFDRFGDHYMLRQIVSPRFGYSTRSSKTLIKVWIEEDSKLSPDTVTIVLKVLE